MKAINLSFVLVLALFIAGCASFTLRDQPYTEISSLLQKKTTDNKEYATINIWNMLSGGREKVVVYEKSADGNNFHWGIGRDKVAYFNNDLEVLSILGEYGWDVKNQETVQGSMTPGRKYLLAR
jgi:hypothetical protein